MRAFSPAAGLTPELIEERKDEDEEMQTAADFGQLRTFVPLLVPCETAATQQHK
jgi:hypothetical protein